MKLEHGVRTQLNFYMVRQLSRVVWVEMTVILEDDHPFLLELVQDPIDGGYFQIECVGDESLWPVALLS